MGRLREPCHHNPSICRGRAKFTLRPSRRALSATDLENQADYIFDWPLRRRMAGSPSGSQSPEMGIPTRK